MVIASGYTVRITADTTFGYNHGLTMSGSAVLASTGDLNIGGIASGNLKITGGTLIAGDVFSAGAQNQTLTADIQAVTANLGSGSTFNLTGSVTATGTVNVGSHATINGAISGATVSTTSPVTLNGDVNATKSFTLASGSTVKGNVTAPVVNLLAASSTVTGAITATTSLQLGSSVSVTGDVKAGTLTLDASDAIINGNAIIDSGVFNWHGRVTKTIYCSGGTTTGQCDCVTNNSGYAVNTANGPHCQGNTGALDHFQIAYDPVGSMCAPSTVTITSCANAACTSTYRSIQTTITWPQPGTNTVSLSGMTGPNPTTCIRNGDAAAGADCKVEVASSGYALTTNGSAFYAEAQAPQTTPVLTVAALRYDPNSKACAPMFVSATRNVAFTCYYANPTGGTLPLRLNGKALNAGQDATAACDNTGATLTLAFDANGKATVPMQYADAGAVTVQASDSGSGGPAAGRATTTFVPAKFQVTPAAANLPYVAGKSFAAQVVALNGAATPAATPNFGREQAPESVKLTPAPCQPKNNNGLLAQTASTVSKGVQTFTATWSETGRIDLVAALVNKDGYLGSGLQPATGTTNLAATGCTGGVGPFSPAYFTFDADTAWTRTSAAYGASLYQYYSGEPAIKLKVTARNAQNGVTQNYSGTDARDVVFTSLNPDGTALTAGAFSRSTGYPATDLVGKAQLRAADFTGGVATWTGSYTFATSPTVQTRLRVRATEDVPAAQYPASSSAIPAASGAEPTLLIRSGRIRMPSRFGPAGTTLQVPVSIEYYGTQKTWLPNTEDSTTALPAGIVSTGTGFGAITAALAAPAFASGKIVLTLKPASSGHGSAPFALNLGATGTNTSCYVAQKVAMTSTPGAGLPFLRSGDAACAAAGIVDPSALATFGVYPPETKRIIHTREVFR
jgi:MSHA biogenesis protein MshQ